MNTRNFIPKLIILAGALSFTGAQCISFGGGSTPAGSQGGVFKSINKGEQWQQKVAVPTPSGVGNFGGANITALAVDPQDHLAIYAGTRESGMLYSFDGGESWQKSADKDVATGFVATVTVDPRNKCIIFVAVGNRILRSIDCNRTFEPIYNESAPFTYISALTSHPTNSLILFAGTSKGAIMKSIDGGNTWSIHANLRNRIIDLIVDTSASSSVYASIEGRGVWKSTDEGRSFKDMSEGMKQIKDGKDVRRLIADRATPGALILASKNKVSRSTDGAVSWTVLPILSPETVEIFSLAVNPKNSKELYYGTATTFYRSSDGGANWSADKLPSNRQSSVLLADPENPSLIYLGVLELKK